MPTSQTYQPLLRQAAQSTTARGLGEHDALEPHLSKDANSSGHANLANSHDCDLVVGGLGWLRDGADQLVLESGHGILREETERCGSERARGSPKERSEWRSHLPQSSLRKAASGTLPLLAELLPSHESPHTTHTLSAATGLQVPAFPVPSQGLNTADSGCAPR